MSLGVFDGQGRLIRTLLSGKRHKAGRLQLLWDGRDDEGEPVSKAAYVCKGLVANLGWQHLLVAGNPGQPPYITADGKGARGGMWGNVMGAATDGKGLYLAWKYEEGTPALVKLDFAGRVQWGCHVNWQWGDILDVDTDGRFVYVLSNRPIREKGGRLNKESRQAMVWRVDAATGDYAWFGKVGEWPFIGKPVRLTDAALYEPHRYPGQPMFYEMVADASNRRRPPSRGAGVGLAVAGDRLYVTLPYENRIAVLDKASGKPVGEITGVASPQGIAAGPGGLLCVASARQVLRVTGDGKQRSVVVTQGLEAPYGVAVAPDESIWVSDLGAAQQLKQFSSEGKLLLSVGKRGGRPFWGSWAKWRDSFLFPTHPVVGPDGTVYVGEDSAPKRLAAVRKGRIEQEWLGPLTGGCACGVAVDPHEPRWVYQATHQRYIVRYDVDYARRTCRLDSYWWGFFYHGWTTLDHCTVKRNMVAAGQLGGRVVRYRDHTFLTFGRECHPVYRVQGHQLVPCAAIGPVRRYNFFQRFSEPQRKAIRNKSKGFKADYFIWRDRNGDWQAQADELQFGFDTGGLACFHDYQAYFDNQMNLYTADNYGSGGVWRFPCRGLDQRGNPIYEAPQQVVKPLAMARVPWTRWPNHKKSGIRSFYAQSVCVDDAGDGSIYLQADCAGKDKGIGWATSTIDAKIARCRPDGTLLWRSGKKAKGFAKPGEFYKTSGISGIAKGCVFYEDWCGQVRVFDKATGLWVGNLLKDAYRGSLPDENVIWIELVCGSQVFVHPKDRHAYLVVADGAGTHFFRITGLEDVVRFQGSITRAGGAAPATSAKPEPNAARGKRHVAVQAILPVPGRVSVDGDLADWDTSLATGPTSFDPGQMDDYRATFHAMYDPENLYVGARVVTPHPPYNQWEPGTAHGWNGDCLIVRLLPDPSRRVPLAIREDDRFFTVTLWYNHKKKRTYIDAYHRIRNGRASEGLDRCAVAVRPAPDGRGYTIEARIPWAVIDGKFRPKKGQRIAWTWEVGIATNSATNPRRAFQIFAVEGGTWAFTTPSLWGAAAFK